MELYLLIYRYRNPGNVVGPISQLQMYVLKIQAYILTSKWWRMVCCFGFFYSKIILQSNCRFNRDGEWSGVSVSRKHLCCPSSGQWDWLIWQDLQWRPQLFTRIPYCFASFFHWSKSWMLPTETEAQRVWGGYNINAQVIWLCSMEAMG